MPVIDVHCHTAPRAFLSEVRRTAEGSSEAAAEARRLLGRPGFADDPQMTGALDERLQLLDEAGIDMELLSLPTPLASLSESTLHRAALAAVINHEFSAACDRLPDRYRVFASLPLPDVEASVGELRRAAQLPGFVGAILNTSFGLPFNDPVLDVLYRELVAARGLLFIHPSHMHCLGRYANLGMETIIGWPAEDTLAVMELVLGGVFDRIPELTVIAPHLSGTGLYLLGRIDHSYDHTPPTQRIALQRPSYYFRRLYYDCVCNWPPALDLARSVVGADHILLGSDFPYWSRGHMGECLEVLDRLDWPEDELSLVRGGNAERLLRAKGRWDLP